MKVYDYARVGVAIFFQVYGVTSYIPQVHAPPPVAIVQQQKTGAGGEPKSMSYDAAAGFLRVRYETAFLPCLKTGQLEEVDVPLETIGNTQL